MTIRIHLLTAAVAAALLAAAAASFAAPPEDEPDGDEVPTAEYVEYRCVADLGQLTIADGEVRGEKSVARLKARAALLERKGVFACVDEDKPHVYRRTDELDGHKFETVVTITPPAGEDDDWTRHLVVRVDGKKKVDCSIGYSPDGQVYVSGVTIYPEEGVVDVFAMTAEGDDLVPPENFEKLGNAGVITDKNLEPLSDDDEPADAPKTLKVHELLKDPAVPGRVILSAAKNLSCLARPTRDASEYLSMTVGLLWSF